jgi:HEXXH motif-containing protein
LGLPPKDAVQELEKRGFRFLGDEEQQRRQPTLLSAADLIDEVPALAQAIREHVRGVSLLDADEAYDISHSEPRWPDWIFVSVPSAAGGQAALRLAENVVHEAMHLQLTRVENLQPLIADRVTLLNSPWKQEPRDLQGNLHGLYVFVCIYRFLQRLKELDILSSAGNRYVEGRKKQIKGEVAEIGLTQLRAGLTRQGCAFLLALLAPLPV